MKTEDASQLSQSAPATGSALTTQQLEAWRKAFPELLWLADDQMIQQFRDNLQAKINEWNKAPNGADERPPEL